MLNSSKNPSPRIQKSADAVRSAVGIVANAGITDFDTKRALALTHLVLGSVTWAGMTAQGVLGSLLAY